MDLANLNDHERQIVGERTVPPSSDTVENRLLHLSKSFLGRFTYQYLEAVNAEHLVLCVEDLGEAVRVKNQPIAAGQVNFLVRLRRNCIREAAKDATVRIEAPQIAVRNEHGGRMPRSREDHVAAMLDKSGSRHREVKTVGCNAVVHEVVQASQ